MSRASHTGSRHQQRRDREPNAANTLKGRKACRGALGIAVGPLVGGVLVQYLDWRSIFLVNIPVGLVGFWLARRHVAVGPRQTQPSFWQSPL